MINYEMFKEEVKNEILGYMPEEFKNASVEIREFDKVNYTIEELVIQPQKEQETTRTITPCITLPQFYEMYKENQDFEECMINLAGIYSMAFSELPDINKAVDQNYIKENIIMMVVNTNQNMEQLERSPHREVCDLSIVYRVMMGEHKQSVSSVQVTHDVADQMGLNEQELYDLARSNMKRLLKPTVQGMTTVISEILSESEMGTLDIDKEERMFVISNTEKMYGAVNMLFPENLAPLANTLGCDLYILPSSIHETIAVPEHVADLEMLSEMVYDINMAQVEIGERLSNEVYHYNHLTKELTQATDVPNKDISGGEVFPMPSFEEQERGR
ncbi:MAG: DUF5688 family protein [Eubacteriales bacterium]